MVKLPVIVYNNRTKLDVLTNSIQLRDNLERQAVEMERWGGRYIRPIVLFQAKPRTSDDSDTFDKIKRDLVELGISEQQIKIKTAEKDELKNIDLMSRDCPVRFIITVNALKEGWDCPFAYILASLANRSSKIDVEQILGRILRLPYATESKSEFLNMGYVFTSSVDFQQTIAGIIDGLQNSGFSAKDYRSSEIDETSSVTDYSSENRQNLLSEREITDSSVCPNPADEVDVKLGREILASEKEHNSPRTVAQILHAASRHNKDFCAGREDVPWPVFKWR